MYQVGDKVIVKARSKRPFGWNTLGSMDKYMGTIQEIEKIDPPMFAYLKGCENWCFDLEDDLMPFPEAGDRIKIRGWEDMKEQYGINLRGDFEPAGKPTFYSEMQYLCGKTFAVEVYGDSIFIYRYKIDPYMIDEVFKRRDKNMDKFTKEDLKDGMIVEYRGGKVRRLVIGNLLLGEGGWMPLLKYDQNLHHNSNRDFDIVKVYLSNDRATNLPDLLERQGAHDLIWEREQPKEIPASEAMKILREKFGCEVKLVEDMNG